MARRPNLSPIEGRIHLRRPVDPPFAFPLQSCGGPYIQGTSRATIADGVLSMRATIKFIMASPTLLLILCASCTKGRTPAPRLSLHQTMSGDGWLSWTPAERSRDVYGYIEGYSVGSFDTCESSTDLFATKLPYLVQAMRTQRMFRYLGVLNGGKSTRNRTLQWMPK